MNYLFTSVVAAAGGTAGRGVGLELLLLFPTGPALPAAGPRSSSADEGVELADEKLSEGERPPTSGMHVGGAGPGTRPCDDAGALGGGQVDDEIRPGRHSGRAAHGDIIGAPSDLWINKGLQELLEL